MAAIGLLGFILSPLTEWAIAELLPRLDGLPSIRVRIATATVTAAACAAFAFRFGADPALPAFILLAVLGVQLARIDVSLHLLPNPLVLFLLLGGLSLFFASIFAGSQWAELLRAVSGASFLFVIYLILALISPGAIGMGDVKLAAPLGLYLGYLGWGQLLYGGLLGFILNGLVTVLVVARNRKERTSEVAHGPSMIGAAVGIGLWMF
ncbi:UNVERIFIED_ORG: leader peptidase (prepilin peptidase)/N-methyltransferase [Arthrobacter sp. UYCu721]